MNAHEATIKVDSPFDVSKFQSCKILRFSVYNILLDLRSCFSAVLTRFKLFPTGDLLVTCSGQKRLHKALAKYFAVWNIMLIAEKPIQFLSDLLAASIDSEINQIAVTKVSRRRPGFIPSNFKRKLKHSLSFAR